MKLKITAYLFMITIFIQLIDQLSKQTSYEDHVTESIFFGFQYIYSNITISFSSQLKYNLENSSKAEYNTIHAVAVRDLRKNVSNGKKRKCMTTDMRH